MVIVLTITSLDDKNRLPLELAFSPFITFVTFDDLYQENALTLDNHPSQDRSFETVRKKSDQRRN